MHLSLTARYSNALMVTLTVLLVAGCGPEKPAKTAASPPKVTVVTASRTSVPITTELPGRTSPYLVAQVRARIDGIVQKRNFEEGDDVKANQLLYQIDAGAYQAALQSAQANLQKAQANLVVTRLQAERAKVLVAGNAISQQTYDNDVASQHQAEADVAAAKAAVANANINLGYTHVTAPISGRSSTSQVTQGAFVQASAATLLTTIQQIDPMYVDLNQSSVTSLHLRRDIANGNIKANDTNAIKVILTLEDGTEYPVPGKLQFNGITVDPNTGSVTVRAIFANPQSVLLPGMFVRARIEQGVNDNAYLVPIPAVSRNTQGQANVWIVDKDNKVTQRVVQAQNTQGNNWVVTAGLEDGERIVVNGLQKIRPGIEVAATEVPAAQTQAAAGQSAPAATNTQ